MGEKSTCPECGADLTVEGSVSYYETVAKTVETHYASHMTEGGVIVTELSMDEDEVGDGGGVQAMRVRCSACDAELDDWEDVEYAH